jgi:hypothetical protein
MPSLAKRISDLASEAESLAESVRAAEEDLPDRTRRDAHRLREVLGTALILSDRLARENGNDRMIMLEDRGDGTGRASFAVNLDDSPLNLS